MVNRSALILQPFGLGDCIFAQGIAWRFIKDGYKIYWPVVNKYLPALNKAYPDINWLPEDLSMLNDIERLEILKSLAIPIRWSNTIMGVPYEEVMKAKYDMYGINWEEWIGFARWERETYKEDELFNLVTNGNKEYNLLSHYYTGNFKSGQLSRAENGLPNIYIQPIQGYSLFDWQKVIERATTIHFVASSNIYLLELLDLEASSINIYPRKPDQNHHRFYDYILRSHKYNLK